MSNRRRTYLSSQNSNAQRVYIDADVITSSGSEADFVVPFSIDGLTWGEYYFKCVLYFSDFKIMCNSNTKQTQFQWINSSFTSDPTTGDIYITLSIGLDYDAYNVERFLTCFKINSNVFGNYVSNNFIGGEMYRLSSEDLIAYKRLGTYQDDSIHVSGAAFDIHPDSIYNPTKSKLYFCLGGISESLSVYECDVNAGTLQNKPSSLGSSAVSSSRMQFYISNSGDTIGLCSFYYTSSGSYGNAMFINDRVYSFDTNSSGWDDYSDSMSTACRTKNNLYIIMNRQDSGAFVIRAYKDFFNWNFSAPTTVTTNMRYATKGITDILYGQWIYTENFSLALNYYYDENDESDEMHFFCIYNSTWGDSQYRDIIEEGIYGKINPESFSAIGEYRLSDAAGSSPNFVMGNFGGVYIHTLEGLNISINNSSTKYWNDGDNIDKNIDDPLENISLPSNIRFLYVNM